MSGESIEVLSFMVYGRPATAGSKNVYRSKRTGKLVASDSCKWLPKWKTAVAAAAKSYMGGSPMFEGALDVEYIFYVSRPRYHFRTGRHKDLVAAKYENALPTFRPDLLKYARAVEDALTDTVWHDDSTTVNLTAKKRYGPTPGCLVIVRKVLQ